MFFLQIVVLAILLTTTIGVVSIDDFWPDEWDIVIISLQVGFKGADGIF